MKKIKSIIVFIATIITANVYGQANVNPTISVLPSNSGKVAVGATLDLLITIGATGTGTVATSKLRPVTTVPASVTFLPDAQQTGIPTGWTILSNTGSQIRICNSTDPIVGSSSGGSSRLIILKVTGVTVSAPLTFAGQMNFGNGSTCANGPAPANNVTGDDAASSTIEVIPALVPVTLLDFNAELVNCESSLKWVTSTETNTDRFEIERSNSNATNWNKIGTKKARGFSSISINYNFEDIDLNQKAERLFYRLKIIDQDGSFKYSEIVSVLANCNKTTVLVYPNPIKDEKLYINILGIEDMANLTLVSASGQIIKQYKLNKGISFINVANVANGVYVLNVEDANKFSKKIKVIIQH